jgi:UDP-4-amino-4,6-dideoxy-N-acetyl-beta-L-altrosamine N-acetyltransferase
MNSATADRVRVMTADDLALVREWRNHPSIRRYMYSRHEVTEDEHLRWFERASGERTRHLLIFEAEDQAMGFVQLTSSNGDRVAEWGFYVSPDGPRGMGRRLGRAALHHCFGPLNFHKVRGDTLAYNVVSIRFHQMLGFQREGVLRDQYFDGSVFCDVHCFGLLAPEWRAIT